MAALCEELLCLTLCDTIKIFNCHRLGGFCCEVSSARQPPSSPASLMPCQTSACWTFLRLFIYLGSEKSRNALWLYHLGYKPRTSRVSVRGKCRLSLAERGEKKREKEAFLTGQWRRCLQSVVGEHKLSPALAGCSSHSPRAASYSSKSRASPYRVPPNVTAGSFMDFSGVIATPTHSSSTTFSVVSTFNLYHL